MGNVPIHPVNVTHWHRDTIPTPLFPTCKVVERVTVAGGGGWGAVESKINPGYSQLSAVVPPNFLVPTSNYYAALVDTSVTHHYLQDDTE